MTDEPAQMPADLETDAMILDQALRLDPHSTGMDILHIYDPHIRVEDAKWLFVYANSNGDAVSKPKGHAAYLKTYLAALDHPDCRMFGELMVRVNAGETRN